jgi:hypothetical protein
MTQPEPIFQDMKGNAYEIVLSRERRFRHDHPGGCIRTELLSDDGTRIVMKAAVYSEYTIAGPQKLLGDGHAEETRGDGYVNEDSPLENCETSAVGRALDKAGYNASGQVASYEEVKAHEGKRERRERDIQNTAMPTKIPAARAEAPKQQAASGSGIPGEMEWASYVLEEFKETKSGQGKNGKWKQYEVRTTRQSDGREIIWSTFNSCGGTGGNEVLLAMQEVEYHGVLCEMRGRPKKGEAKSKYWDMHSGEWCPWDLKRDAKADPECKEPDTAERIEWLEQHMGIRIHPDATPDRGDSEDQIPVAAEKLEPAGSADTDDIPF